MVQVGSHHHPIPWSSGQLCTLCWDTLWYRAPGAIATGGGEVGGQLELCQALHQYRLVVTYRGSTSPVINIAMRDVRDNTGSCGG